MRGTKTAERRSATQSTNNSSFFSKFMNSPYIYKPQAVFFPSLTNATAAATGFTTVMYTTGILSASVCLPVFVGMIAGLLPARMIAYHLDHEYRERVLSSRTPPYLNQMFHFVLRASTDALGLLIGLATASFMATIAFNPFTTPALIAGGVSATIIVGLYLYLGRKMKQAFEYEARSTINDNNHRIPSSVFEETDVEYDDSKFVDHLPSVKR